MSDTPIADRLATELGVPWMFQQWPDHQDGSIDDFESGAPGSETGVLANPHQGAVSRGPVEAAPAKPTSERTAMSSADVQREQLRAAAEELARQGKDTNAIMWAHNQVTKNEEAAQQAAED